MKLENIIENLKELKREFFTKEEYSPVLLDDLIKKLEQDYKDSLTIKKPSDKVRLSAIKKVINNNSGRTVLHGYSLLDNKIVFTDSYQLYVVNDKWLPFPVTCGYDNEKEVKELAEKYNLDIINGVYPNVKNVIPDESKKEFNFKVNLKEVTSAYKTTKQENGKRVYNLTVDDKTSVCLDLNYLNNLIKIMRISDDFELEYYGEYRPLIYRNNEEIGLILPIKVY